MVMNQGLQKHTVKKKLKNRGIRPDKIDLEAELDSSLSLTENINNLEEKYGRLEKESRGFRGRQERAQKQRRDQVKKEAREINQKRSKYSRYVDATKDAETVYRDPSERQFEKWKENPNEYDIEGVDTRKPAEKRPQTKLPIQRDQRNILYTGSEKDLVKSMNQVPGSITRNVNGTKEQVAEKKKEQGMEERLKQKERIGVNQNALISNYDVPDVVEEERKAKRSRANPLRDQKKKGIDKEALAIRKNKQGLDNDIREIGPIVNTEDKVNSKTMKAMKKDRKRMEESRSMIETERKERLQADNNSRASEMLKDSRNIADLGKNTEEKSDQSSLRDGYASKSSEKTLDKWQGNYL